MTAPGETRDMFGGRRILAGDGYAAAPGTGPAGETCGTCEHFRRSAAGFHKCAEARRISHGPGTDVRVTAPACAVWRRR